MAKIADTARALADEVRTLPIGAQVAALNEIRTALHEVSPFADPVDLVLWVPAEAVQANDYNPNKVAEREMLLLIDSIKEDLFTQPIVTVYDRAQDLYIVVDGFHRTRVGKEVLEIRKRLFSYLPVTVIDKPLDHRMASTTRHNRARGKHQVDLVANMVKSLTDMGWGEEQIAQHLGMTYEEIVRLKQQTGVAAILRSPNYSRAWGVRHADPRSGDESTE